MTAQDKPQFGQFCWNELMTSDASKAKDFYKNLFGWTSEDNNMGEFVYTMYKSGDQMIGGMMQIPADEQKQIPPHWMNYVFVESVDNELSKAEKLGAKVIVPATPVSDFGRFAILQDPTGAHFGLWQSMKDCE